MRITSVESIPIRVPLARPKRFALRTVTARDYTIVRVKTDAGVSGWGYTWGPPAVARVVADQLAPVLLGEDALLTTRLWERMYRSLTVWGRGGLSMRAIGAVDVALWDLKGQVAGLPIWQLLGGCRRRVPVYYSGGYYLEDMRAPGDYLAYLRDEITRYLNEGFSAFKIKVGVPGPDIDLQRVAAARELIGDGGRLMLDANNAYSVAQAVAVGQAMAAYHPAWFEEPVAVDDLEGLAEVRRRLAIPVAVGENHHSRWQFREILERQAADVLQGDPILMGGITEWLRLAGAASTRPVELAPHNSTAINVHLGAAFPQVSTLEYFAPEADIFNFHVFIKNPNRPVAGELEAPERPGHGVVLDEDALNRYAL